MAGGDVEGFAAVAFPLVRRVFGGLIANDLVSVQPMSLPSGLIFFLDFQAWNVGLGSNAVNFAAGSAVANDFDTMCRLDPDLSGSTIGIASIAASTLDQLNKDNLVSIALSGTHQATQTGPVAATALGNPFKLNHAQQVRRLTQYSGSHKGSKSKSTVLLFTTNLSASGEASTVNCEDLTAAMAATTAEVTYSQFDDFGGAGAAAAGSTIGVVAGQSNWGLENDTGIPEIDIKVDSVSVTAMTKKLKAKWTPELAQDLNAYHNLDAEVELTGILSEQIALEIDREILEDLVKGGTAETLYWSRHPGKFVNRTTGVEIGADTVAPDFTGTVSEWYETLVETINDVSAQIHRKTLRGGANFIVVSPEVANVLEFTSGFRADVTGDADRGTVGTVKTGSLSKKWDVYVDPYFPRNIVLVGRKGGSFLESGYVYAPYVPLQVTPTIFGVEDFVPRKGVMTRYAKKMVRADMYGLVVVLNLVG
jgi:hypothetical protein